MAFHSQVRAPYTRSQFLDEMYPLEEPWTNIDMIQWPDATPTPPYNAAYAELSKPADPRYASYGIVASNFHFMIPSDAAIFGLTVEVKGFSWIGDDSHTPWIPFIYLSEAMDDFAFSDTPARYLPYDGFPANAWLMFGSQTGWPGTGWIASKYSPTLPPSVVNSANFTVFFHVVTGANYHLVAIDAVRVTIWYGVDDPPPPPSGYLHKVLGVSGTSIGKVRATLRANVSKVLGK
jgi:hypothetical protein